MARATKSQHLAEAKEFQSMPSGWTWECYGNAGPGAKVDSKGKRKPPDEEKARRSKRQTVDLAVANLGPQVAVPEDAVDRFARGLVSLQHLDSAAVEVTSKQLYS